MRAVNKLNERNSKLTIFPKFNPATGIPKATSVRTSNSIKERDQSLTIISKTLTRASTSITTRSSTTTIFTFRSNQ